MNNRILVPAIVSGRSNGVTWLQRINDFSHNEESNIKLKAQRPSFCYRRADHSIGLTRKTKRGDYTFKNGSLVYVLVNTEKDKDRHYFAIAFTTYEEYTKVAGSRKLASDYFRLVRK